MKTIRLLLLMMLFISAGVYAQTSCTDLNVYPMTKNTGSIGVYNLRPGYEEKAAQTYYYSSSGSISQVRIYGNLNYALNIPLNIVIYNVDSKNRPTTVLKSVAFTWYAAYNVIGYLDVNVGNVFVSSNFAIAIEIPSGTPSYKTFSLSYNGDGEGGGEDLASLAGTSTGYNWTSAKTTFNKDGDFYLLPKMNNFITAGFTMSSQCIPVNGSVNFTNTSQVSNDYMFNKIGNPKYSGSNYLLTWDFGDNSPVSHNPIPTHKYTVSGMYYITLTVTFEGWANTCTDVYKRLVSVGLTVSATKITKVICNGYNTGSVTASATGGVPPYNYSINGNTYVSSPVFSSLYAGSYILYTRDSFGCIQTTALSILEPSPIIVTTAGANNSTCGKSNGAVSLQATGGTGSLAYNLNDGSFQTSGSFSGLAAGHKRITIKDSIGCTSVVYIDVTDAAGPVLKISSFHNITCNGDKSGTISATSTSGTGTIQYSINGLDFQASGLFDNLYPGTYGVTVKDANGCIDLISITLTQPSPLVFYVTTNPASCHGSSNGSLSAINATGGSGNYSYSIDGQMYQSGNTFSGLKAGSYLVYLKDAAGCIAMVRVNITEPDQLNASASAINAKCFGSNDGTITVSANGGTTPYRYSINGINYQPVNIFQNVNAGFYSIMVSDANGCFYPAASVTVTQPTPVAASITITNATCGNTDGKFLAEASGGSGSGYKFSIDGGVTFNNTGLFSNLKDSTYALLIEDGKTCTADINVTVISTNGPKITSINHTDVTCNGGSDGSITIGNISGGTGALSYYAGGFYWQSTPSFSGLTAGNYTVIVKDAVGCIGSSLVTIKEPAPIVINVSISNPLCYQSSTGTATINAAGGNGIMAYSFDDLHYQSSNIFRNLAAGEYIVSVRDAGQCVSAGVFSLVDPPALTILSVGVLHVSCNAAKNGAISVYAAGGKGKIMYSLDGNTYQANNSFSSLSGGLYNIFVKDSNNCQTVQYGIKLNEPTLLSAGAEIRNVMCSGGNDGIIILTAFGGTRPYTYQWSNFATSEDNFNLSAGVYSVIVSDANGCTFSATYTVTQPAKPLIVNGAIVNAHSGYSDGSIKLTITGGSGFFDFQWSNGATTQDVSGLAPGQYTVIVKDVTGCQVSETFAVSVNSGIEEYKNENLNINIFPNPANDIITIDANNERVERIIIIAIDGKIVIDELPNEVKPTINTSTLTNGLYFVNFYVNGRLSRQRLEIQR